MKMELNYLLFILLGDKKKVIYRGVGLTRPMEIIKKSDELAKLGRISQTMFEKCFGQKTAFFKQTIRIFLLLKV